MGRRFGLFCVIMVAYLAQMSAQGGKYLRIQHGEYSWYAGVNLGISSYRGDEDRYASDGGYLSMLTSGVNLEAGKWVNAQWGIRAQLGSGSLKGWSNGKTKSQNPGGIVVKPYFQDMSYMDAHVDLVLRPINILKQSDEVSTLSLQLFGGLGIANRTKLTCSDAGATVTENIPALASTSLGGGMFPIIVAGANVHYKVTEKLLITGEIKGTAVQDKFDGFAYGRAYEGWGTVSFGVSYIVW